MQNVTILTNDPVIEKLLRYMAAELPGAAEPLVLLERSSEPACAPASQEYTVDRLFHQMLMPEDPERMMKLLSMADCLVETVPCYRLLCDMSHRSVEAAYEAARK